MSADRLQVLLVEDSDGDAMLVSEALEDVAGDDVALRRAASLRAAIEVLVARAPAVDVVLLDLGLPDAADGVDALRRLLAAVPDTSVIVLTGLDDGATAAAAVEHGAQDYLIKTAAPDGVVLLRAVRFAWQRGRQLAAVQAARDELGAFAHTVAHDLRSPLAAIVGLAQLLVNDDGRLDTADRDRIAVGIRDAGSRLSRMVTGLLAYAEQAGADRAPVRLDDVVDWVVGLIGHELEEVGGAVEVDGLTTVLGDEPALRTVVLNLVSNAIKYRHHRRPLRIDVSAEEQDDRVVVTVGDNGVGIRRDDRERVFTFGQRAAADSRTDGVGIGLSSVRRIIGQLDGEVWIEGREDGDGTRVRFSLPGVEDAAMAGADGRAVGWPWRQSQV